MKKIRYYTNNTDCEPYNREVLLDCLIDNKCGGLTAADLVVWGTKRYDEGREAEKRRIKYLKSKHKGPSI